MNNERNRRIITILSIFTIIFTVMGGSLAYWNWSSTTYTGVAFTIDKDFTCSADGGGNITPTNISLEPSSCTNPNTTIKRKIVVTPDIKKSGLEISLDMWLNINSIGAPLSNSINLKYVLTTSGTSCEEGTIISSGHFNSKTSGDRVMLLEKNYTADASETYYLYIWLDKEETSMDTMNQSFNFSLGGNCSNYLGEPEAPVLDPAMIPVTIANDGTVTTVSKDDPDWYNYENKQWANIVLVNENATDGVTDSHSRSYYQNNIGEEVTGEDILAYYVWIPRYKYKIPTNKSCGDIIGVNPTDYPECYENTYTLLNESAAKSTIKSWMESNHNVYPCSCNFDPVAGILDCSNAASNALTDFLDDGQAYIDCDGMTSIDAILTDGVHYQTSYELVPNKLLTASPTSIDIIFESKDENMILGNATTQYRSHPAFWWDEDEDNILDNEEMLSGIWFSKFEPIPITAASTEECFDWDEDGVIDDCYEIPQDVPGILPNQNIMISPFVGITNVPTNYFGINFSDMHAFKSRDWGAVAYLSHSEYGINKEIRINNTYFTGCGAATDNSHIAEDPTVIDYCEIKYGSGVSEYPQSTTGNISGVFDMSGSFSENPNNQYGLDLKNNKYYDAINIHFDESVETNFFDDNTYCDGNVCYGYALTETKNWYSDLFDSEISILGGDTKAISMGGSADDGANAGIFSVEFTSGVNRYVIVNE